jgi:hypothetical protein
MIELTTYWLEHECTLFSDTDYHGQKSVDAGTKSGRSVGGRTHARALIP